MEKSAKKKISRPKVLLLISGGIDSVVAGLLLKDKYEIIPVHMCLYPFYCSGSFEKMINILKKLKKELKFKEFILFPHSEVLSRVLKGTENLSPEEKEKANHLMCLFCRRSMFKSAELICDELGAEAIVTGEAIGQKASQTLDNLLVTSYKIKYPILRPLIGMNKDEIIPYFEKFGAREEHVGCCSVAPKKPSTAAQLDQVEALSEKLELDKIIKQNIKKMLVVKDLDKAHELLQKIVSK